MTRFLCAAKERACLVREVPTSRFRGRRTQQKVTIHDAFDIKILVPKMVHYVVGSA